MNAGFLKSPPSVTRKPYVRTWPTVALVLALAACEAPLNTLRASRLGGENVPAVTVTPRAVALALTVAEDQQGLTPQSVREANRMLHSQGRLSAQTLSITPFTARGEALAQRLAKALSNSGARAPSILPRPSDAERLAAAERNHWDLELQSEAMVADLPTCRIARPDEVMLHPHESIGALGCATRANIAAMVSDPRDLMRPRTLAGGNGAAAAAAVTRYQDGEIRDLIDIDFEE